MKTLIKTTICVMFAVLAGSTFAQPQYKPYYRSYRDTSFDSLFSRVTDHGWLFLKDTPAARISPDTFLTRYTTQLGLSHGYVLKAISDITDTTEGTKIIMRHQLFQTHYKNIPVEGNEFSMHSIENILKTAHGRIVAGLDIDVSGAIDASLALQTALGEQRLTEENFGDNTRPNGSLILATKDEHFLKESYRLAWVFDLKSDKIQEPYRVNVDARTGGILKKVPLFMNCSTASQNNGNHYVDYAITGVPAAGAYYVKLRYYSSAAPTITVQVNGGSAQTVNLSNSGSWNIVSAEQTMSVNLAAGNNTIRIQGAGGGSCRQDRICVNSNANARVGIVEQEPAAPATDLFVSPNPNSGQFEVPFYLNKGEAAVLSVLDMRGNAHFRQTLSGEGIQRQKISLSNIPSGTYLVQIKRESGSTSTRTIILK